MTEQPTSKPVKEFGNAVRHVPTIPTSVVESVVQSQIDDFNKTMSYITDFEWVEEPKIVYSDGANDLNFIAQTGWYGKAASNGYDILRSHFDAGRRHIPETITLEFVNEIIAEYLDRYMEDEDDE